MLPQDKERKPQQQGRAATRLSLGEDKHFELLWT